MNAALAEPVPADGESLRILIDAEHLDAPLHESGSMAAVAQSCIYRPSAPQLPPPETGGQTEQAREKARELGP